MFALNQPACSAELMICCIMGSGFTGKVVFSAAAKFIICLIVSCWRFFISYGNCVYRCKNMTFLSAIFCSSLVIDEKCA